ncbi:hypothetical protein Cgig2_021152 [Carnegiea gigantea]|uniref:Uncharacterized protein n=1 Tax=Carnegiea gigantea TaxID=171969 RepID=A0A9Q1KVI8_9CARY|nr:hypothetical protein Cgig2_021152 [Carnegiea gigantea]
MAYEQILTPAARLRAVVVELEKDRTRTKQSKVNSRYFFNPQYMYRQSQDWEDREVRTGVQNVIMRLESDVDKQIKEQPVFEGDDLNWLNFDENEVNDAIDIEDDDDPQPDAIAPFCYSVDQQSQHMQGNDCDQRDTCRLRVVTVTTRKMPNKDGISDGI